MSGALEVGRQRLGDVEKAKEKIIYCSTLPMGVYVAGSATR